MTRSGVLRIFLIPCVLIIFFIMKAIFLPDIIRMRQYIRKADIILLIVLIIAGLAASAAIGMSRTAAGGDAKVIIESGGSLYASYPLSEDRTVIVPSPQEKASALKVPDDSRPASEQYTHYNVVTISGGKVCVSEGSCKNQVCVHHAGISHGGETIVCLPNRLVVRIDPGTEKGDDYDSISS